MRRIFTLIALAIGTLMFAATSAADPGEGRGEHPPKVAKAMKKAEKKAEKDKAKGEHGKKNDNDNDEGDDNGRTTRTFTVVTTDNGSCGTPWATDTVRRTFVVQPRDNGTFRLTRIDRGTFTTIGGTSPGACDTTGEHGHVVRAGVVGKLRGFITGTVSGGTFNPNATCTGPTCGFTDVFLTTFFGPNAQFSCNTNSTDCRFNFVYKSDAPDLTFRRWQDKGTGAGEFLHEEFNGDIATA